MCGLQYFCQIAVRGMIDLVGFRQTTSYDPRVRLFLLAKGNFYALQK